MVLPNSHKPPRNPRYSRTNPTPKHTHDYRTLTLSGSPSQMIHHTHTCRALPAAADNDPSYNPNTATPAGLTPCRFRLHPFRSPLLRVSQLFSLPPATEMFHFTGFPPHTQRGDHQLNSGQVLPFGNPQINIRVSTPCGISQTTTAFIGH